MSMANTVRTENSGHHRGRTVDTMADARLKPLSYSENNSSKNSHGQREWASAPSSMKTVRQR